MGNLMIKGGGGEILYFSNNKKQKQRRTFQGSMSYIGNVAGLSLVRYLEKDINCPLLFFCKVGSGHRPSGNNVS